MTGLSLRPVDPVADAALLHRWVTQPRAEFWGMLDKPLEEVREIYTWIDEQPHVAAYLVSVEDVPVTLFQTYDPEVDEIGQFYERLPGDVGVHLLMADTPARAGRTRDVMDFLLDWLFEDPENLRIVFEPDQRNARSLRLIGLLGAQAGPRVDIGDKPAQFGFLTREDIASLRT